MSKMILAFIMLFCFAYVGVQAFVAASGSEKLQLIKSVSYAMVIAVVVVLIAAGIVILF